MNSRCPHLRTRIVATYEAKMNGPQDPRVICDGCGTRVGDAAIERDPAGGYIIVPKKETVPA